MKVIKSNLYLMIVLLLLSNAGSLFGQSKGLKTITEDELRYNLEFLAAPEFRGRETPSTELEIATVYLGNWAKKIGLKPLFKDGSFYQSLPLSVTAVFQPNTRMRVTSKEGEHIYYYGRNFGGNFYGSGSYSGNVVFVGLGLSDPKTGWDDLKDVDLTGKTVIILDTQLPGNKFDLGFTYSFRLGSRVSAIRNKGAAAVFSIVNVERDESKAKGVKIFDDIPSGRMETLYDSQRRGTTPAPQPAPVAQDQRPVRPSLPFGQAEIDHDLAASLLGITKSEVRNMFNMIKQGKQVPKIERKDTRVQLNIEMETYQATSRNVIGVVEGSDPKLKDEYIVICGHHDHLGISDGEIIAGADDNGTATVALMEITRALLIERPKRSVIIAWFTGEERGLLGSHYFVNNCPIPKEKIATCLNMDMLGRNNTDSLYLVGSNLLSSELDASINKVNKEFKINLGFDYTYSNLTHPQRVYFRSDHYPFLRFGIPSVWFFCGFTHDYHTPNDVLEFIDYKKVCKVAKLVYLSAYDIGNRKELLKLDVNPEVTSRGVHNMNVKSLYQNTK